MYMWGMFRGGVYEEVKDQGEGNVFACQTVPGDEIAPQCGKW